MYLVPMMGRDGSEYVFGAPRINYLVWEVTVLSRCLQRFYLTVVVSVDRQLHGTETCVGNERYMTLVGGINQEICKDLL